MDMWWEWGEKPNVLPHPPTAEPCVAVAIIQILKWSPSGEVNYIYTTHTHTHRVNTNTCTNTNTCGHARANIWQTHAHTHTPGIHAQILTCADMPGRIYNQTHTHWEMHQDTNRRFGLSVASLFFFLNIPKNISRQWLLDQRFTSLHFFFWLRFTSPNVRFTP